MEKTEVVVTGMGTLTSLGNDATVFFESLLAGKDGIRKIGDDEYKGYVFINNEPKLAGRITNFVLNEHFTEDEINRFDVPTLKVLKAVEEAVVDAGVNLSGQRVTVIVGSAVGLRPTYERINSSLKAYVAADVSLLPMPQYYKNMDGEFMLDTVVSGILKKFNITGAALSISAVCASGAAAIGLGTDFIRQDAYDLAICVGFDFFHPRQNRVFSHNRLLSEDKIKPFDKNAAGFQLAEGVGSVILESEKNAIKRGKHSYGKIKGWSITNDAYHLLIPTKHGKELAMAVELALQDAGMQPGEIEYINLIGRGSPASDERECNAIMKVFGPLLQRIPVNSLTSFTGYSLAASSILNTIAALLQMRHDTVLPNLNLEMPAEKCQGINFIKGKPAQQKIKTALICSTAFTGVNSAVVLEKS